MSCGEERKLRADKHGHVPEGIAGDVVQNEMNAGYDRGECAGLDCEVDDPSCGQHSLGRRESLRCFSYCVRQGCEERRVRFAGFPNAMEQELTEGHHDVCNEDTDQSNLRVYTQVSV